MRQDNEAKTPEIVAEETQETSTHRLDLSKALKMYLSGIPQVDIATFFGVSRQAVSNALRPFKLKHPEGISAYEENRAKLISEKELLALQAIDGDKLKKASARDLAITFGTLFDKRRLQEGSSTKNVAVFSRMIVDDENDL